MPNIRYNTYSHKFHIQLFAQYVYIYYAKFLHISALYPGQYSVFIHAAHSEYLTDYPIQFKYRKRASTTDVWIRGITLNTFNTYNF
jgi:hypothetical protein